LKKQIKWLSATAILISASLQPVWAKSGVWEVYQKALHNDPQILASEMVLRATEERVDQSFGELLPSIVGSYSLSENKSEGQSNILLPTSETESSSKSLSLSLSQVIYDHRAWMGLDIRKKQALKAGVDHEAQKQALIVRVAEAYFNLLSAQDGLDFSKAEMKAIEQELEQTKQKFEVGLIAITDVHEAQARYDQATADSIRAQNTLDNAIEALREITNEYYDEVQPLKSKFALRTPEPATIEDWIATAEQHNLTLSARKIDKDIARETVKLNFAGHYPTINLSGSYRDSDTTDIMRDGTVLPDSTNQSTNLTLSVNVPIYSGGKTQSTVREAQHLFQQAVYNMESAYRSAVRQTRSAYLGIMASISSVKALEQTTISSQAALEATQAGFEVGTRTIVDVLNSTRVLYNARQNLARARYDYILNTLKLKQAAGTLTEQDLLQVDKLLQQ
jgi:outer membrane protein